MPEKSNIERLSSDVQFVLREKIFKGDESKLKYDINHMSNNEIFDSLLNYEGLRNYSGLLRRLIEEIYEVKLNETRTTVTPVWFVDEDDVKEACNILNFEYDNNFIQEVKEKVISVVSDVLEPMNEDIIHNAVYDVYDEHERLKSKVVCCEGCDNE